MLKRSIIYINGKGFSPKRENRISLGDRFDKNAIMLSVDLYLLDTFKPLFGDHDPLVVHNSAHAGLLLKHDINVVILPHFKRNIGEI